MVPDKGVKRSLFGFSCSAGRKNNILLLSASPPSLRAISVKGSDVRFSSLVSPFRVELQDAAASPAGKSLLSPEPHAWGAPLGICPSAMKTHMRSAELGRAWC